HHPHDPRRQTEQNAPHGIASLKGLHRLVFGRSDPLAVPFVLPPGERAARGGLRGWIPRLTASRLRPTLAGPRTETRSFTHGGVSMLSLCNTSRGQLACALCGVLGAGLALACLWAFSPTVSAGDDLPVKLASPKKDCPAALPPVTEVVLPPMKEV